MPALHALSGVHVVDLGIGKPAAIAAKIMVDAGATVTRFEPREGDPFYPLYPAYSHWQQGKTIYADDDAARTNALRTADICIIGGEEYPDLDWRFDAAALHRDFPSLIILDLAAAPQDWHEPGFPAVEILAQARSGFVFTHYPDRPLHFALPVASYGAALHGTIGALSALLARGDNGPGEIVTTSLLQGALRWSASIWVDAARPSPAFRTLSPKGVHPLRFACADGKYIAYGTNVPRGVNILYDILGIDDPNLGDDARGSPTGGDVRNYFGNIDLLTPYFRQWQQADILAAMEQAGLPVAAVEPAGACWDDPQTPYNHLIERDADGWQRVGMPFRFEPAAPKDAPLAPPPAARPAPRSNGPLSGVRVVDLGSFAAGPHASVVMADLGADVIKIERLEGDPMRAQFHHYAASNRGKRSIAVDGKSPDGRAVIHRICATVDAVHHNFRPGVSARLGVDRAVLKDSNPDIIVLESPAYGPNGPRAAQPGYDSILQAHTGHQPGAGGVGNPPLSYRFAPIDYSTGVLGALSMVLGLLLRQRQGVASVIHASLFNAGVFMLSEVVRAPDGRFAGAPYNGASQLGLHPAECLYQTNDGWIAIAARGEAMATRLLGALGLTDQIHAPLADWAAAEEQRIASVIRQHNSADALALLHRGKIWAERCAHDVADVLNTPQMEEWGMTLVAQDPEMGLVRQVGTAVNFARNPPARLHCAMRDNIGGHSREILTECGFTNAEIDDLFARRIIG